MSVSQVDLENESEGHEEQYDLSYLDQQMSFDSGDAGKGEKAVYELGVIVDPESGTYKTIQQAIEKAENKDGKQAIIKVNSGLYKEKLIIRDKAISLQCNDTNSEVYICGETGGSLIIDNDPKYVVEIEGINFSTKGTLIKEEERLEGSTAEKGQIEDALNDSMDESRLSQCFNDFKDTTFEPPTCCVIKIVRGKVIFRKCVINLNLMAKNTKNEIINLGIMEGCEVELIECELRGKIESRCLGIFSDKSHLSMTKCIIRDFKLGALMIVCKMENQIKVVGSHFMFNKRFGIHLLGDNESTLIQECIIQKNECPGIKIMAANKAVIRENQILINTEGIKIKSADPVISGNTIKDNYRSGIVASSVKVRTGTSSPMKGEVVSLQLTPRILKNFITSNKEHGIFLTGHGNLSYIKGNQITGNNLCGIKVQSEANPLILSNHIRENNTQGILFVENSWGKIIDNDISHNSKANIALGGQDSMNSYVSNNRIKNGYSEGIFIIKSGRIIVRCNDIEDNNDGIILVDSYADITRNSITNNKKHGVFMLQNSRPIIKDNLINGNKEAGIYIKGRTTLGKITTNNIHDNTKGIFLEKKIQNYQVLKENNTLTNNAVEFPTGMCSLV